MPDALIAAPSVLLAVVELLHKCHVDPRRRYRQRRHAPRPSSANSRWGNHRSVLTRDWLYMQVLSMALEERNFRILDILIELTQKMGKAS